MLTSGEEEVVDIDEGFADTYLFESRTVPTNIDIIIIFVWRFGWFTPELGTRVAMYIDQNECASIPRKLGTEA